MKEINDRLTDLINEYRERRDALARAVNVSDYFIGQNAGMSIATSQTINDLLELQTIINQTNQNKV